MDAEVVVAGAGPAGAATAAWLAEAGVDVLLLDRARFPREKACAEFLSPGAVACLDRLRVLPAAAAAGSWQEGMRIVAPGASFTLRYRDGQRGLGVSRARLDALLHENALRAGARAERADVAGALVEGGVVCGVRLRGGGTIRARFVVAADGIRSPVARSLGLDRPAPWPRRIGLVARFRGVAVGPVGLMATGRVGYCGVADVGHGETSVGLVVPSRFHRPGETSPQLFARALAGLPAVRDAVSDTVPITPLRGMTPLARRVARVAGPGYLLVGDAAGFLDPFTGEGVHRALRGAELAAPAVLRALRAGSVDEYAAERRRAFAAKTRACLALQAALAAPVLLRHGLRRAERRERAATTLAGVFGDYLPAGLALRPAVLADLLRP